LFRERVKAQSVFHQHSQAVDAAAEVDRIPTEIHRLDVIGRPHHGRATTVVRTRDKVAASTFPLKATAAPLDGWTRHWLSLAGLPPTT